MKTMDTITPTDLRHHQFTVDDASRLIAEMASCSVILATYASGGTGVIKGNKILDAIIASGRTRALKMMTVLVANTTQIELLLAALKVQAKGKFTGQTVSNFAEMLSVAATVPGGMHDDVAFKAALALKGLNAPESTRGKSSDDRLSPLELIMEHGHEPVIVDGSHRRRRYH